MSADLRDATPELPDLTSLGGTGGRPPPAPGEGITEKPFNKEREQEKVRGWIALSLVWTFILLVGVLALLVVAVQIACVVRAACGKPEYDLAAVRTLVELLMTPLVGLVGAVSGFYFGEKSTRPRAEG